MIYGIEETTDSRHPETRVQKFRSKAAALKWASVPAPFAWPGAADARLPVCQQNWHHRLREVYEMPPGWRPPTKATVDADNQKRYRNGYRGRSLAEVTAICVHRDGIGIPIPRPLPDPPKPGEVSGG